jgi:hypothetical protein
MPWAGSTVTTQQCHERHNGHAVRTVVMPRAGSTGVTQQCRKDVRNHAVKDCAMMLLAGSTGGALLFAKVWREAGLKEMPTLVEFGTLTYGVRSSGTRVQVSVKAKNVMYGTLPADKACPQIPPPPQKKTHATLTSEMRILLMSTK